MKEKDIASLQHTTWRCQYHVVFAPKCRRMAIYGQIKKDIGQILRTLCDQKGVEIIEAQACPDHIHMLLSIPPKYSVSQIMGLSLIHISEDQMIIQRCARGPEHQGDGRQQPCNLQQKHGKTLPL